jgi:hypothetical protein
MSDQAEFTIEDPDLWKPEQWKDLLALAIEIDKTGMYAEEDDEAIRSLKAIVSALFMLLEQASEVQTKQTIH